MTFWGAVAGGFIGTLVLTTALRTANELGLTRIDLPFLLGTAVTRDRSRAKALGYLMHLAAGELFALAYFAVFAALGTSGWLLGGSSGCSTEPSPRRLSSTSCCPSCIRAWEAS